MTTDKSQTIVGCTAAALVVTYVGNVAAKKPMTIKPLIGGFVAGTLLLGTAMWVPDIAAGFAVLILVSSLVINGTDVFKSVGLLTSGSAPTPTPTPSNRRIS